MPSRPPAATAPERPGSSRPRNGSSATRSASSTSTAGASATDSESPKVEGALGPGPFKSPRPWGQGPFHFGVPRCGDRRVNARRPSSPPEVPPTFRTHARVDARPGSRCVGATLVVARPAGRHEAGPYDCPSACQPNPQTRCQLRVLWAATKLSFVYFLAKSSRSKGAEQGSRRQ